MRFFSFLYCFYYNNAVLIERKYENSATMKRHISNYLEAYNLMLRLAKNEISKDNYLSTIRSPMLQSKLDEFLNITENTTESTKVTLQLQIENNE
jgi:hypothetical protein